MQDILRKYAAIGGIVLITTLIGSLVYAQAQEAVPAGARPAQTAEEEFTATSDSAAELSSEETAPVTFPFNRDGRISFAGLLAKTIGYFLLIVLLIFASVYLLKRYIYNRKTVGGGGRAIQILSSTYVGPKKSLMLVEAAGRILVLSVTDTNMNLITELTKEEYGEYLDEAGKQKTLPNGSGGQFGDLLHKILKRPQQ